MHLFKESTSTIIGSILSIRLIDKFSSRSICGLSFLVKTGIFLILAKVGMPYKIIMCVFLLGLTSYTFKIANTHWVTRQCDSEKIEHKSINLLYVASNLGLCVSAMIISFAHISEFIDLFYIFAAITLLAIIALKSRDDSLVEYSYSKSMAVVPNKPVLRVALASVFIIGLMIAQISITYPLYLYHMFPNLGLKSVSIVSVIEAFAIIIFQMPLLALLEKQNKILMLGLGVFLYGLGLFILKFSSVYLIVIGSCLIYVLGEMIFMSVAQLLCSKCAKKPKDGQILSLYQSVYTSSLL